jgi:hypothetical protein
MGLLACGLMGALSVSAAEQVVDDFSGGVEAWQPQMQYGDVARCQASRGKGANEAGALRVDFDFGAQGTNHIIYARDCRLDLSAAESLSFDVKGVGDQAMVFLFLWDSQGRFCNYGPHGTNYDFQTGYPDWHRCEVSFDRDRSVQGGDADLGDVRRIGFMLNQNGPKKGTVWFASIKATDIAGTIRVSPTTFSPTGDGVYDTASFRVYLPREVKLTVEVLDAQGTAVATLARDLASGRRRESLTWDGLQDGKPVPEGEYTVRARFAGAETTEAKATVKVDTSLKWPPVKYDTKPFFPIGVWFEGAPSIAKYPDDPAGAKRYYGQCFADLKAHGFNAAAVPNCPGHLWEPLLQSAQEHGIKIVLEVPPLIELVSQPEPASEAAVSATANRVHEKIGKYESLLRYQVRDEPPPQVIPNWLLVRRIMAAADPTRPTFSCFCDPASLAAATEHTALSEAVFDIYPHNPSTPLQSLGGFLPALDRFTAAAKGSPPWVVLQAFAAAPTWRYPTPEELRAVTYVSLAAGVKGVFYFIYSHMPGYLDGMVGADGQATAMYEPTAKLAQELGKLAPMLLTLKPAPAPTKVEGEVRVGSFRDPRGGPVLIVASTRPGEAVTARLTVGSNFGWQDALSGERLTPQEKVLTVPLGPGAGRVLVQPGP